MVIAVRRVLPQLTPLLARLSVRVAGLLKTIGVDFRASLPVESIGSRFRDGPLAGSLSEQIFRETERPLQRAGSSQTPASY